MKHKVSAIILASGKGERAGFCKNKLLVPLCGAPALWHTLEKFNIPEIDEVVVTSSPCDKEKIDSLCKPFGYKVVTGGSTRTESVKNALCAVTGDIVLIHDGARPFVKKELIINCIESVKKFGSGVCAVKVTDTLARAELGMICDRPDRDGMYRLQTPQGFFTDDIREAYSLSKGKTFTDDSAVYCEYIGQCRIIDGDESNIKLTYREDFENDMPKLGHITGVKVGFGVDTHAFGEGSEVTLGGIKIPCDKGLVAHSDGDVIIHALMDALLSAAGLKDIGHYFPDTDEKYRGADSAKLLEKVVELVYDRGYALNNASITVQAEKPRLSPHIDKIIKNLAEILKTDENNIAVSAGTNEKLGYIGQGLGITVYCAVLLKDV